MRPITGAERQIYQNSVERVYGTFTRRVAEGRNITVAEVDSIGQGRVWSGSDALNIKLVDVMGGLDDAIAIAAAKANLTNYRKTELPRQKEPFMQIMEEISGDAETRWIKHELGDNYNLVTNIKAMLKISGVQARSFDHHLMD